MTARKYILAVDLGTSGCKAALVTFEGQVAAWHFAPVTTHFLPGGGAEQEPRDWWAALVNAARALRGTGVCSREDVAAVCCTTQGEGTVAVDRSGNSLARAILWMDIRSAEYLRREFGGLIPIAGYQPLRLYRWIRLTGGAPSITGKDPAGHMLYVKYEWPEIYRKTYKFLNVLDYMNLRLTGRFCATFDSILTSWVTDNRNPDRIVYNSRLVRNSGIDADKFPEIVRCTDTLGTLTADAAQELDLPRDTPVVAGAIDSTAAPIGSGTVGDFATHLYLGTSSWLAAHVPFKKTDLRSSMASVPCAVPGRYLLIALQATACGNLSFLCEQVLSPQDGAGGRKPEENTYQAMDRLAETAPPCSQGVIYTPWIFGERAPVEDRYVRAGIHNLSFESSRADIVRALFEGVAFNTRWLLEPFERFIGRPTGPIHVAGGGANSNIWCQIMADVMNRPIRQVSDPIQANVRGAAFIAAAGLGRIRFTEVPKLIRYSATYTPHEQLRSRYDAQFAEFLALYRQTRGIYRRLNAHLRGQCGGPVARNTDSETDSP